MLKKTVEAVCPECHGRGKVLFDGKAREELQAVLDRRRQEEEEWQADKECERESSYKGGHRYPSIYEQEKCWHAMEKRRTELLRRLRSATVRDYAAWLGGHLVAGGGLGHVYDYPFPCGDWFVAKKDIETPVCLFGALKVSIIVPDGVMVADGGWGHCDLYYMDGYRRNTSFLPPLFSDVKFI